MLVANVGLDEVCWFGAELGFSLWCGVEGYFLLGFEVGVWGLGLSCGFRYVHPSRGSRANDG